MREFTEEEIEKWIDYTDKNVLPKEEFLGRCHQCGDFLVNLELPEGPEKKIVCLKDREKFVSDFEELAESELEFQPELLKKDDSGLIPGEIILLAWCSGKNTKKRIHNYFYSSYAVDVATSIDEHEEKEIKKTGASPNKYYNRRKEVIKNQNGNPIKSLSWVKRFKLSMKKSVTYMAYSMLTFEKELSLKIQTVRTNNWRAFINDQEVTKKETIFEQTLKHLDINYKNTRPHSLRQNGNLERSHCENQARFNSKRNFKSVENLLKKPQC